jgi:hypothetical protein
MKTVTEIIAGVRAAMDRNDVEAKQRAARAAAYTGPERRRAPRIGIIDDVPPAQRPAEMKAKDAK